VANRLAASTSPYLRQHADNPVDWWEWSEDAFAEARRRDVPVLLSVGYAACHWCHVMAHESFEDEATAALMNEHFVNVKVDREERPDVDAVYMEATQAMTGHGGWPMTCFLTPDGKPFHCGTYYPPRPRPGVPGFPELLRAVHEAWASRGDEVREAAGRITAHLTAGGWKLTPSAVDAAALDAAVGKLAAEFDGRHGGFGDAPKFPPSMVLEFLLRHHERTGSAGALEMAVVTAERMARGGLYDQLAGGFARYSVDARWVVPHFEKMLYDNALLLRCYAHLARLSGSALARRVAEETGEFLLRELCTPEGGFASSLDADAAGVEGSTYVWTRAELADVLGQDDGAWAASLFEVTRGGTFEHGASVLQLLDDPSDAVRYESVRSRLLAARAGRVQPGRDDKVITAWNGLAITALAEAGAALRRTSWVDAAASAADLLLRLHLVDGRLRRSSRNGTIGSAAGVLEDHGALAMGLLALHQATASARWLTAALSLLDTALDRFAEPGTPGRFYDTADDAEPLVSRPRDPSDNASPSGASVLAEALLTASALTGSSRYREVAEDALSAVGALARQAPRFAGHWLTVAEAVSQGPLQIAITLPTGAGAAEVAPGAGVAVEPAAASPPTDPAVEVARAGAELLAVAREAAPGGAIVIAAEPDAPGVPLMAGRPLVDGRVAAYVCRGFVCDAPVTTPDQLRRALTAS
jgi:uncharacterized protein